MSGGHSLHKKDWLKIGVGLAAAGTGLGAAGMGPLAGLLGGSSGAGAGAAGLAEGIGTAGQVNALTPGLLSGGNLGAGLSAFSKVAGAMPQDTPQAAPQMGGKPPQNNTPIIGANTQDAMPTTPFSPLDPVWAAWMKRHGQGMPNG